MNKEKTIELRKNMNLAHVIQELINKNGYAEIYAYCSKNKKLIYNQLSGKVLFKFRCYNVKTIRPSTCDDMYFKSYGLYTHQINNYLNNKIGFEIYISNLEIFDKSKEISEFKHYNKPNCDSCQFQYTGWCDYHQEVECDDIPLTKAPQNFCYINIEENL